MRFPFNTAGQRLHIKSAVGFYLLASTCLLVAMLNDLKAADKMIPQITVRIDNPIRAISPLLYGICLQEINHACDGGLYAELIPNRSFEFGEYPEHWYILANEQSSVDINVDDNRPMSKANLHSLRMKIDGIKTDDKVGVANSGYWGISLAKDNVYDLSLAACANEGFSGQLTVNLESIDGKEIYAAGTIGPISTEWKTYKLELNSNATSNPCRLAIYSQRTGTIWLDMVSLIPRKTWQKLPGGLRPDLAEMIRALQSSFIRFLSSCPIESSKAKSLFPWKQTICDMADRSSVWNKWQYVASNGFGVYEYLQFCDALNAKPWLVIDCTFENSKEKTPPDRIDEYIQSVLETIEYANGPETSAWGAIRAKSGHPQPFNLEYIEINNESRIPVLNDCCVRMCDAVKAKYPHMNIVTTGSTGRSDTRRGDMVNERYFGNGKFFIQNAHKYDAYDRKDPKVCLGEYAVTHGAGQGNLRAAVAEAAFMTGLERNSDVVRMAAYSPLLANVNCKNWNPNLINFDGRQAYGTPSYYVQKMFAEHRGDYVLPLETNYCLLEKEDPKHGAIGLGTWATQAEYKDITVTQGDTVLFKSDFSKDLDGWEVLRGDWDVQDGALRQTTKDENPTVVAGDKNWTNYTLSLKARKLGGNEGFLVLFHVMGENDYLWWNIGGWRNSQSALEMTSTGKPRMQISGRVPCKIESNRWYDIRIKVDNRKIRCYLDGTLIQEAKYPGIEQFVAVSMNEQDDGSVVYNKPTNVHCNEEDAEKLPKHGAIGIATWQTLAEFKDIRVTQGEKTIFNGDDAKSLSKDWSLWSGDWQIKDGVIQQTDLESGCRAIAGDKSWTDYSLSLKARKLDGKEGFLIMFRVAGDKDFIWWNIGGWGGKQFGLELTLNGAKSLLGKTVPGKIENDRWYDIRIDVDGKKIRCYLDGELIHLVNYPTNEPLFAVAALNQTKDEAILKVINVTDKAQETEIVLDGDNEISSTAKVIVLTSEKATDENSLDNPTKVSPVETTINNVGHVFRHIFPPNSVNVMQIKFNPE
jgi:alpha-L-arabinofuranosidase